jgi:fermentation-respiration switch protein FrsA (DUF1100 family)
MNRSKTGTTTKSIKSSRRKFAGRITVGVVLLYVAVLGILMFLERYLVFPSPPVSYGNWDSASFGAKEHFIEGHDKTRIHVWTFEKPDAKTTLIFSHGNGESLGMLGDELMTIRDQWNVNVVAFDYRGYGKTGGIPNERDILSDAVSVGKWVQESDAFRGQKIIAMGRSLGGAPAIEIATEFHADGLILDRTFSSIVDVAASRYFFLPVRWVMQTQFKSIDKIPAYQGELLQMHGDVDEVIPYRFGKKLFDACPTQTKKLLTVHGLYHNSPWPREFWDAGKKFIKAIEDK